MQAMHVLDGAPAAAQRRFGWVAERARCRWDPAATSDPCLSTVRLLVVGDADEPVQCVGVVVAASSNGSRTRSAPAVRSRSESWLPWAVTATLPWNPW